MSRPKVLITGAASGIGRATALRFAHEGYDVCVNDIQAEKLAKLLNELPQGNHLIFSGSYADKEVIAKGQQVVSDNWGTLDVLVSCAGISSPTDPLQMDIEEWRVIFDTMVNGCILISKLAAQFMPAGGRI